MSECRYYNSIKLQYRLIKYKVWAVGTNFVLCHTGNEDDSQRNDIIISVFRIICYNNFLLETQSRN